MATTGRPPPAVLSGGRCGPGEGTVPVPGSQKKVQAAEGAREEADRVTWRQPLPHTGLWHR